ncbi:Zinc phosphodiesterase ELAC protein 2 [Exophiala dermatitidis]
MDVKRMQEHRDGLKSVGVRTVFHLQFVTTPTSDTPGTSVILHFDSKRYVFGEITEGTQRACIQRGIGLRKVRGLFLSGKTTWNNGGLIGLILSLADIQQGEVESETSNRRPRLDIHAGPKQLHSLACARRFVFRTGMPLSVHEIDAQQNRNEPSLKPIHEDDNIRVWALCVQPAGGASSTATGVEDQHLSDSASGPGSHRTGPIDESQLTRDQTLRRDVVNNMFDSDWRRDQLVQSKLKDVKLPALVWVRDPESKKLVSHTCFDLNNTAPLTPDTEVLVRNPWPASTVQELPPASDLRGDVSMSYIVKGYAQRGSFDIEKANSLGLKPGPVFRTLVAGQSVKIRENGTEIKPEDEPEDGTIITPDMVMTPTRPGRGFALFDLPSTEHLEDLERQLNSRTDDLLDSVQVAIWMTRGGVLYDLRFRQLLQRLQGMKHIISDPDVCHDYIVHTSSALSSLRLSNIASEFFSVPRYDNLHGYRSQTPEPVQSLRQLFGGEGEGIDIMPANRGLKVHIEPTFVIDESEVPKNQELREDDVSLEPPVQECLPADMSPYRRSDKARTISSLHLDEPEIVTLGTGSAAPSKYRNVSAVLLRMPDGMGNYLFDAGEGTLGQLSRLYTAEQLDEILYTLKGIWISHLHADHHLGTVSVLEASYEARRRLHEKEGRPLPSPPCLISEVNMIDFLDEYQSVIGIATESLCIPIACHWLEGLSLRGKPFQFGQQTDVPIQDLQTVKVNHCHGAQAVTVTFQNGFKFSYSGDCRPNERFCEIGKDSDVLVHEATFDDGMEGDAMAKKHCTTGEAVGVALEMKAKNLILTHFSQRYQKIPVLSSVKMLERVSEEELIDEDVVDGEMAKTNVNATANGTTDAKDRDNNNQPGGTDTAKSVAASSTWVEPDQARDLSIGIAFDLMRVKVSQIKTMKPLFPAISKMFEIEEAKREKERLAVAAALQEEAERKKAAKLKAQQVNKEKKKQKQKEEGTQDGTEGQTTGKQKNKRNKRKLGQEQQEQQEQLSTPAVPAAASESQPGSNTMAAAPEVEPKDEAGEHNKLPNHNTLNAKPAQHESKSQPQPPPPHSSAATGTTTGTVPAIATTDNSSSSSGAVTASVNGTTNLDPSTGSQKPQPESKEAASRPFDRRPSPSREESPQKRRKLDHNQNTS